MPRRKIRMVSVAVGPKISSFMSVLVRCNGPLANTSNEPVITRS
jgi:hypothetical protein